MRLSTLSLQNFGPHADLELTFGPGLNLLCGPNACGKTRALAAIAYAITGACHLTTRDGKKAESLLRTGAKEMQICIHFASLHSPHLLIADEVPSSNTLFRSLDSAGHRQLIVNGGNGTEAAEAIGYRGSPEALGTFLQVTPIVTRPLDEVTRVLAALFRPEPIMLPESFTALPGPIKVTKVSTAAQLAALIAEIKDQRLRDAKREAKKLEAQDMTPKPCPIPAGWDEVQLRGAIAIAERERSDVLLEIGALRNIIKTAEESTSYDGEALAILESKVVECQRDAAVLTADLAASKRNLASLAAERKRFPDKIPPHCPSCTCANQNSVMKNLDEHISNARQECAKFEAELEAIARRQQGIVEQLERARKASAAAAQLPKAQEDLPNREQQAADLAAKIANARSWLEQLAAWKAETAQIEARVKEYLALTQPDGTIAKLTRGLADLERLRSSVTESAASGAFEEYSRFLQPFGIENVSYTDGLGFSYFRSANADGEPTSYLSDGEAAMFAEAGLRVAAAKKLGLDFMVLDHLRPLSDENMRKLLGLLAGCGLQVIMCLTTSKRIQSTETTTVHWLGDRG